MKINFNKFLLISLSFYLVSTSFAQAAGLVECGNPDASGTITRFCTYCDFLGLIKKVMDFGLINLLFPLATIMIVVGGFFILTSAEIPDRVNKGKSIITQAVIGILIALLAWLVLDTIFKMITNYGEFRSSYGT